VIVQCFPSSFIHLHKTKLKNIMPNYHNLYTPQDSAVVFIDHQPQTTFGVANTIALR